MGIYQPVLFAFFFFFNIQLIYLEWMDTEGKVIYIYISNSV